MKKIFNLICISILFLYIQQVNAALNADDIGWIYSIKLSFVYIIPYVIAIFAGEIISRWDKLRYLMFIVMPITTIVISFFVAHSFYNRHGSESIIIYYLIFTILFAFILFFVKKRNLKNYVIKYLIIIILLTPVFVLSGYIDQSPKGIINTCNDFFIVKFSNDITETNAKVIVKEYNLVLEENNFWTQSSGYDNYEETHSLGVNAINLDPRELIKILKKNTSIVDAFEGCPLF